MVTAESLITKQNVPLRRNSALFNKWISLDYSYSTTLILYLFFHFFMLFLLGLGFANLNLFFFLQNDTTMFSNDSPPFSNETVTEGLNDRDVRNASELIRQLREYSNGSDVTLGFDNQIARITFKEMKNHPQLLLDDLWTLFHMLILLLTFSTAVAVLYKLERHVLSNLAFISFGPYSTRTSRLFLFSSIAICVIILFLSKFHPAVCIDSLLFIPLRIYVGYTYSYCKTAYFDIITRYSQFKEKKQSINASEEDKLIFLRNAVRKELIAKTSKLTDVIWVSAPVSRTFVVKGLLLEQYEKGGQQHTTEAEIEWERYQQYCEIYGEMCADKELTVKEELTIDTYKNQRLQNLPITLIILCLLLALLCNAVFQTS